MKDLFPEADYAAKYHANFTGKELRRLQLISNAARMRGPAGTTAFFVNVDEWTWFQERLRQIKREAG